MRSEWAPTTYGSQVGCVCDSIGYLGVLFISPRVIIPVTDKTDDDDDDDVTSKAIVYYSTPTTLPPRTMVYTRYRSKENERDRETDLSSLQVVYCIL